MKQTIETWSKHAQSTLRLAACLATLSVVIPDVHASTYPSEAVRIVVPYAAGGANDTLGRVIAQGLGEVFKQTFYVDNRPGAGQVIGTDYVVRAAPNGSTLLLGGVTHAINASLLSKLPYDSVKSLTPAVVLATSPLVCVTSAAQGIKDMRSLVRAARENPNKFSYASSGNGAPGHLTVESIKHATGISMLHVPYKGASQPTTDLLSGRVHFYCVSPIPVLPYIKDGSLVALAVTTSERSPVLPDVPTLRETGIDVPDIGTWYALFAPAGTPAEIVEKINEAGRQVLQQPNVQKTLRENGLTAIGNSRDEASRYLITEIGKWRSMIHAAGIRPD